MMKNVGTIDRVIRILVSMGLVAIYYFNVVSGTLGVVVLVLAGMVFLTSVIGFCSLYALFGISTCSTKNHKC